jgi:hypothetical protein
MAVLLMLPTKAKPSINNTSLTINY